MKALVPAWRANSISQNWFNEFDQLFENLFDQKVNQRMGLSCDIDESEKFILFSIDLPGLVESDIDIQIKNSILQIEGERKPDLTGETTKSFAGRHYGSFKHSFRLPKSVDQEKIEADYTSGVLKILLPKTEAGQAKRIEVKTKKGNFLTELLNGKKNEA